MKDKQVISECVEALCNPGCESVRDVIAKLETGADVPETEKLSAQQRSEVLLELKRVMAVYDRA